MQTTEHTIEPDIAFVKDEIDTVACIEPQSFLENYVRQNRPLKMTGMMDAWPAMRKWSFDFFRGLGSQAVVNLEEGNVMQSETGFRKETFSEFIERLQNGVDDGRKAYLSVFRIFDEFPELRSDVDFSILDQFKVKASTSGWIGPAGTVTGYHIDWGDNILAQVCGRKSIHLAAPNESSKMYVSKKFDQGTTISEVDLDCVDERQYPLFESVRHQRLTLHPGEMVFIPRGWWHHVRSLDASISVSNITFDWPGIFRDALPHRIKQKLHDMGLWKCDCTCHIFENGKWIRK